MGESFGGDDAAMGRRAGGTARTKSEEGIDSDCLHAVLDHPRRRLIIDVVTEQGTATTRDVATQVAARERDISAHEVTDEQHREVTIALHHVHIPKLTDVGILELEEGIEQLCPGPKAGPVLGVLTELYADIGSSLDDPASDA